jgi:hypothetical protein
MFRVGVAADLFKQDDMMFTLAIDAVILMTTPNI